MFGGMKEKMAQAGMPGMPNMPNVFKKSIERSFPVGEFDFMPPNADAENDQHRDEEYNLIDYEDYVEQEEHAIVYRLFPYGYQRLSKGKYPDGFYDGDPANTYDVRIEIGVVGKKDQERLENEEAPLLNKSGVLLVPRYVCCKSPYLERGIQGQEGKYLRPLNGGELQIVLDDKNGFLTVEAFTAIIDVLVGLKKNLTSKIFGYLARCEEKIIMHFEIIKLNSFFSKFRSVNCWPKSKFEVSKP